MAEQAEAKKILNASVAPEEFDWEAFEGGELSNAEKTLIGMLLIIKYQKIGIYLSS